MNRNAFLTLIAVCLLSSEVFGQKQVETQNLVWTRYHLKADLSDTYRIRQEIENRMYWSTWQQHQFVARTFVDRKLGKGWSTGAGFTYFEQTLPHAPDAGVYTKRTELRPQLELSYTQNLLERLSLNHRYWSEFRIFEQPGGDFKYGNTRFRYKLELRYDLWPDLTLTGYDEIHLNIGNDITHNVFDQNRYGGSIRYKFTPAVNFEIGYINWFQQRTSGFEFFNRHIIRFTLHHNINLKKSA